MLTYWEILTAIQSNVPVNDSYTQLWGRKSQGGYTVATYTGTLPVTLTGTKAGHLQRYKIYGNTVQSGTPTPDNPIMPSECGERTGNLYDQNATDTANGYIYNAYLRSSGNTATAGQTYIVTEYIPVVPGSTCTISRYGDVSVNDPSVCFYDSNHDYVSGVAYNNKSIISVEVPVNAEYLRFSVFNNYKSNTMLTEGSTAPAQYIPYGYKLPLTSAGQDVDIYLGENQTTRWIRKLVLTGDENWIENGSGTNTFRGMIGLAYSNKWNASGICSHLKYIISGISSDVEGCSCVSNNFFVRLPKTLTSNLSDFKAYLAAQYANGTPVTIWYVLATEETGTLNEPLRKIGGYADTIDSAQTSTQIPTSAGSTAISWAGEGLAPSQVELEYEKKR